MSRIPRGRQGDGFFHVVNRAQDKRFIFEGETDRAQFLSLLVREAGKHEITFYHWVIMSNHFHLAAEVRKVEELSAVIGKTCELYTRYWRRRHGGNGTLWQGRFKSFLVQKDGYLGKLGRYIERNPVRAGMVEQAWDYKWSSAQAYLNDEPDALVRPKDNAHYQSMGATSEDRRECYVQYLLTPAERVDDEELFRAKAAVIGDDQFRANVQLKAGRLSGRRVGRPRKPKPQA